MNRLRQGTRHTPRPGHHGNGPQKARRPDLGTDRRTDRWAAIVASGLALAVLAGCQPTVRVQAPDKPIVINLNVKIEQDVRVRLEKDVEQVLDGNPDIF